MLIGHHEILSATMEEEWMTAPEGMRTSTLDFPSVDVTRSRSITCEELIERLHGSEKTQLKAQLLALRKTAALDMVISIQLVSDIH